MINLSLSIFRSEICNFPGSMAEICTNRNIGTYRGRILKPVFFYVFNCTAHPHKYLMEKVLKIKNLIFAGCWITISKFLRNVPYSKDYSQRLCQPKNHRCLQRHPNLEGWNRVLRICQKSLWRDQKWANGGGERRCQQTYLSLRKNKAVNSVNLWFLPKTNLKSYQSQNISRSNIFHRHFYLPEVNKQVQNDQQDSLMF